MESHPWFRRHWPRTILAILLCGLLAACTASPPRTPEPPVLEHHFEPLADGGPGVDDALYTMAARESRVVVLGYLHAQNHHPTFRFSDDEGATWHHATLSSHATATMTGKDTIELDTFAAGPGAGGGWLVLGRAHEQRFAWTSADGSLWDRRLITGIPTENVTVEGVIGTDTGWIAHGAVEHEPDSERPAVWTSTDGVEWRPVELPGQGSVASVASRGNTVVAVGHRDDDGDWTATALVSTDGGATWAEASLPATKNKNRVNSLSAVVVADGQFVMMGHRLEDNASERVVLASTDGRNWVNREAQTQSVPVAATMFSLTAAGKDLLSVAIAGEAEDTTRTLSHSSGGRPWVVSQFATHDASRPRIGSVQATSTAVLAISMDHKAVAHTWHLWRSTDGGATFTEVAFPPASATATGPATNPQAFARSPDGSLAVTGSAQNQDVLWKPDPHTQKWLPQRLAKADPNADPGSRGVSGPPGWLFWQAAYRFGSEQAALRTGGDPATLEALPRDALNPVKEFHSSTVNDAIWAGDRWLVVGEATTKGSVRQSALAATSPDGKTWRRGRGATVLATGDDYSESDQLTDLAGLQGRGRSMCCVAQAEDAYLAFGSVESGGDWVPAMWRTQDKETWALTEIDKAGLTTAVISHAAARGSTVVLQGTGTEKTGDTTKERDWLWVSTDAGKTWKLFRIGPDEKYAGGSLTATPRGFVYAMTAGTAAKVHTFFSADGLNWTPLEVRLPHAEPHTVYDVKDLAADGEAAAMLIAATSPSTRRTIVVKHRL